MPLSLSSYEPLTRFGAAPVGSKRAITALTPARKQEALALIETLLKTATLIKQSPVKDDILPGFYPGLQKNYLERVAQAGPLKVTLGPNQSQYTIRLNGDTTFTATRADNKVTIELFKYPDGANGLAFAYTNTDNPRQNVLTPDVKIVEEAINLSKALNKLKNPPPPSEGFEI